MSEVLTFEISNDYQEIEIHGNVEGLTRLMNVIRGVIENQTHEHLMTPSWSGNELTEEIQGENTKIINKVSIGVDMKFRNKIDL